MQGPQYKRSIPLLAIILIPIPRPHQRTPSPLHIHPEGIVVILLYDLRDAVIIIICEGDAAVAQVIAQGIFIVKEQASGD